MFAVGNIHRSGPFISKKSVSSTNSCVDRSTGSISAFRFCRQKTLYITVAGSSVCLWRNQPRLLISCFNLSEEFVSTHGSFTDLVWKPDGSAVAFACQKGYVARYQVMQVVNKSVYTIKLQGAGSLDEDTSAVSVNCLRLIQHSVVYMGAQISSLSSRKDMIIVACADGSITTVTWLTNTAVVSRVLLSTMSVLNGPETHRGYWLGEDGVYPVCIEPSPWVECTAFVLSDGRCGMITTNDLPVVNQGTGVFSNLTAVLVRETSTACSLSVNNRNQFLVFGLTSGEALAFCLDETMDALVFSHKYSLLPRDYPDGMLKLGAVIKMAWTADFHAMAMAWQNGGLVVWSLYGSILCSILESDTLSNTTPYPMPSFLLLDWGMEGHQLFLVPDLSKCKPTSCEPGEILQLNLVRAHPSCSGEVLVLLGDDTVWYHKPSEISPIQTSSSPFPDQSVTVDITKNGLYRWTLIRPPNSYIQENWPLRYAAADREGRFIAAAGSHGYTCYNISRQKWKLYRNEIEEKSVIVQGGMAWWEDFLVVTCYTINSHQNQIRLHHSNDNFDRAHLHLTSISSPALSLSISDDVLLVYCLDTTVLLFQLEAQDNMRVLLRPRAVIPLNGLCPHPLTLISALLIKGGDTMNLDSSDSLLVNVSGQLTLLHLSINPESQKVETHQPMLLASCVENYWLTPRGPSQLDHSILRDTLWITCGAQGMKAWVPLNSGSPIIWKSPSFLTKRIMLNFELQINPIAVSARDTVIFGVSCEKAMPISPEETDLLDFSFALERTTQIYLPCILQQLLKKNLGSHALVIANSCKHLPYFLHVLELMLHEVVETEATSSVPIPDPLLPCIVAFIREFPEYLKTFCHCARKTEVALWSNLFACIGNPQDLIKECLDQGLLETAASYLLIIQNLEPQAVSRQIATQLLDSALESKSWELCRDLVRFLRAIGNGEQDGPSYVSNVVRVHPCNRSKDLDDMFDFTPLHRTSSNSVHPSATRTGSDGQSLYKKRSSSTSPGDERKSEMVIDQNYFMDVVIHRHARKCLSSMQLLDLGYLASNTYMDFIGFLFKERSRAAVLDSYLQPMQDVLQQFHVCHLSRLKEETSCTGNNHTQNDIETSLGSDDSQTFNHRVMLAFISNEKVLGNTPELSETSSMANPSEYDPDGGDPSTREDLSVDRIDKDQSLSQLRYLLKCFLQARCLDWGFLLSIICADVSSVTLMLDNLSALGEIGEEFLTVRTGYLRELLAWSELEAPGYSLYVIQLLSHIEVVSRSVRMRGVLTQLTVDQRQPLEEDPRVGLSPPVCEPVASDVDVSAPQNGMIERDRAKDGPVSQTVAFSHSDNRTDTACTIS